MTKSEIKYKQDKLKYGPHFEDVTSLIKGYMDEEQDDDDRERLFCICCEVFETAFKRGFSKGHFLGQYEMRLCPICKHDKQCVRPYGTKTCDKWELAEYESKHKESEVNI